MSAVRDGHHAYAVVQWPAHQKSGLVQEPASMRGAQGKTCDVCVLGGGPAGTTIALRLAVLGYEVMLVEREEFPRRRVGESLPPGVLSVLDRINMRHAVEAAGFLRPGGAIVKWAGADLYQSRDPGERGLHVDRGRFDMILLAGAVEAGVTVLQPCRAERPMRMGPGSWRIPIQSEKGRAEITAAFVVDATGATSLLGGKKSRLSPPTVALYAYWADISLCTADARVEAGAAQWYWAAPLPDGTINVAVFADPAALHLRGQAGMEWTYRDLLARSDLLQACQQGRLATTVTACDASCRIAKPLVGMDFIKVGDAATALDPLSSQGVQRAMVSALQGAAVVNTILRHPDDCASATKFYRQRQSEAVRRNLDLCAEIYGRQADLTGQPFWTRHRNGPVNGAPKSPPVRTGCPNAETPVRLSPTARLVTTPVLRGDRIVTETALSHPSLDRCVAFLCGVPAVHLLEKARDATTVAELWRRWRDLLDPQDVTRLLEWSWGHGIIVPNA